MPRILKNIRIDEVSACTKGVGVGTRIVLMKRDDSADDFDEWHREQAAIADAQNEKYLREDDEREEREESVRSAARKRFQKIWKKHFADDGDDDPVADGGNDHHASKVADLLVESANTQTVKRLWITCYTPQAGKLCRAACTNTMRTSPL